MVRFWASWFEIRNLDPEYVVPHVALTDLGLRRGQYKQAKRLYERALILRPNFAPAARGHAMAIKELASEER